MESPETPRFPFVINGYEFRSVLGSGTYSQVYKVFSNKYQSEFAAKVTPIEEDSCPADDQELGALIMLNHPNIIRCYDCFIFDNNMIMILELCEGGNVAEKISNGELKQNLPLCRKYMTDILNALDYCVKMNIAHRDIKPNNIYVDSYGRAKVADFGLSTSVAKHQLTNIKCGSYNYAAPEIFSDEPIDAIKTDIWSLGVTFYEMMVGKLPWGEDTPTNEKKKENISFPHFTSESFRNMILLMLDSDPNARPSLQELQNHRFFSLPLPLIRQKDEKMKNKAQTKVFVPLAMMTSFRNSQLALKMPFKTSDILASPKPKEKVPLMRRKTFMSLNPLKTFDTY